MVWRFYSSDHQNQIREWQQVVVYQILDEIPPNEGLSFGQLLDAYHRKIVSSQNEIGIPLSELTEVALNRILLDLQCKNVVWRHVNGHYAKNDFISNPRFDTIFTSQEATYKIIDFLTTHGGEFDHIGLQQELDLAIPNDEYHKIINDLIAQSTIMKSKLNGKLYTRANYPLGELVADAPNGE
jgi:hypothetical protein